MTLAAEDFTAFFEEVWGYGPFPWQVRLLRRVAETGAWPDVLDLPTGSGKTAAIDIAVFHLALEADSGSGRRAPVRIAFVVDRRLVVDDAHARAERLAEKLRKPEAPITARVAERLKGLAGDGPPLIARRLRGGIPRESDWARTPSQPTVLCSTVDQVGSRLLFRGYGVSDSMKPVHAGLIGSDCLILLDEAHLAEPFRQTLDWVRIYKGRNWRECESSAPWGFALLTATLGTDAGGAYRLEDDDRSHPVLKRRLEASKPARLFSPVAAKTGSAGKTAEGEEEQTDGDEADLQRRAGVIAEKVQAALRHFEKAANGAPCPAIGVVVNRVARARAVHARIEKSIEAGSATLLLLIGPARPLDRDHLAKQLAPIRTAAERTLDKPFIIVATQCIEVGVDIDLDSLITEAAPLDALRQRFGRLNRAGRPITPYAAVVAAKSDLAAAGKDDPVYGATIKPSWERLIAAARKTGGEILVDFGLATFGIELISDCLSPRADAPVLLPAHLDLLSQTSPIPRADPDASLYLHGPDRQPDSISVVWRADLDPETQRDAEADIRRLLTLVPPRSSEAIELPIWAVRRWLAGDRAAAQGLADVASIAAEQDEGGRRERGKGRVFRWKGNDERSRWITGRELRPGDAIIVPTRYGGLDEFGWSPGSDALVTDLGRSAAEPFSSRSFVVRVAPGLIGDGMSADALADALAGAVSTRWRDLRAAVQTLALPEVLAEDLRNLDEAKGGRAARDGFRGKAGKVVAYTDLYGDDDDRPRGVVFVAPFGIRRERKDAAPAEDGAANSTEDDVAGSLPGYALSLQRHSRDVEGKAEEFARSAGLPAERVADLKLAGWLHDAGKADPRFQAWLNWGDPFGPDPSSADNLLAKSGRWLPRVALERSGLPPHWRHEALSVRLALRVARFGDAEDPDLVLWLVGTHHGRGRPLYPHTDPDDALPREVPSVSGSPLALPAGAGPQSLAFDWRGQDWPTLFVRLKERYGVWELSRMEAIVRLADHRASEDSASAADGDRR